MINVLAELDDVEVCSRRSSVTGRHTVYNIHTHNGHDVIVLTLSTSSVPFQEMTVTLTAAPSKVEDS